MGRGGKEGKRGREKLGDGQGRSGRKCGEKRGWREKSETELLRRWGRKEWQVME